MLLFARTRRQRPSPTTARAFGVQAANTSLSCLYEHLRVSERGLTQAEAQERLLESGFNYPQPA